MDAKKGRQPVKYMLIAMTASESKIVNSYWTSVDAVKSMNWMTDAAIGAGDYDTVFDIMPAGDVCPIGLRCWTENALLAELQATDDWLMQDRIHRELTRRGFYTLASEAGVVAMAGDYGQAPF